MFDVPPLVREIKELRHKHRDRIEATVSRLEAVERLAS